MICKSANPQQGTSSKFHNGIVFKYRHKQGISFVKNVGFCINMAQMHGFGFLQASA
jgi:hypothetical protein